MVHLLDKNMFTVCGQLVRKTTQISIPSLCDCPDCLHRQAEKIKIKMNIDRRQLDDIRRRQQELDDLQEMKTLS